MISEKVNTAFRDEVAVTKNSGEVEAAKLVGDFTVTCYDSEGNVKWQEPFHNLVTTEGKNTVLDRIFQSGVASPTWYMGLISSSGWTAVDIANTMGSHSGWTEATGYSAGTRPSMSWTTAAASGSKTVNTATSFSLNATATIKGCFVTSDSTKSGVTGILYSAGLFTGGDKSVANGDTLNVTYTASL